MYVLELFSSTDTMYYLVEVSIFLIVFYCDESPRIRNNIKYVIII